MSVRVSVPAIFCVVSFFGVSSALHAQTVGADRIYQAEARAAALQAQNQQLKQSVATQSAALKRLDNEINVMQQDHQLQLNNLNSTRDAELRTLREGSQAKIAALREANAKMNEQIQQLQRRSSLQAQNEAELQSKASGAQLEAARLDAMLTEQSEEIATLRKQVAQLQAQSNTQRALAQEAPVLRKNFAKAVEDNKALRLQLAQSDAERIKLKEQSTQQQQLAADNERLRSQLSFMQERNTTLQEALSAAPSSDQINALQNALDGARQQLTQAKQEQSALNVELAKQQAIASSVTPQLEAEKASLQSALRDANRQVQQNAQENKTLRVELAQLQASSQNATDRNADHTALQAEYNQLLNGIRSCEAQLQQAQNAPQAVPAAAQTSSHPEDIRRIAELEAALDRANGEIRNANRAFQDELQLERAMAASSEVELEQQYQKRINAMQEALQSCRAG